MAYIHTGTDVGFAVDKIMKGEAEMRGLLQGFFRPIEGLDEPFAQPDKILAQQVPEN